MSIFQKIFLSVIAVTVLGLSVCGHIIIDLEFHNSLDSEFESSKSESIVLRNALATAVYNYPHNGSVSVSDLKKIASNLKITTASGELQFELNDEHNNLLCKSNGISLENFVKKDLENEMQDCLVATFGNNFYVVATVKTAIDGRVVYLQTYSDITDVFEQKDRMYLILQILLPSLAVIIGGVTFVFSKLITNPIKRLSYAEMQFAQGDFSKRVEIKGSDEICRLSQNFNFMADKIEENISELKDSVKRQEDFTGNFAHELKTPLTSIIGYSDMLRSKKLSPEQQLSYADYIFKEGKRLEALSKKLMELMVLKREKPDLKPVSTAYLAESVENSVQRLLFGSGVTLSVNVKDSFVKLDFELIKTVLINLIDNARKASKSGDCITLSGKTADEGYLFAVEDMGVGISEEDLPRVTEEFYMADKSRARKQGGAGMGLALCKRIIELHNGVLKIFSKQNEGTKVQFLIKEDGK